MAVQGITPFIHVSDSNGNPYVGANLYVYTAGTTTLKAIYSDDALSVALANPLTSDSAGKFARFYMAAGTYKLKATTSAGVEIWTYDNLDTGLSAGTGALPISGGGTSATTAAAARAALDVPSNSEITALSSTISDLQTSIQNIVSSPQGYLTPTSGTPVITGDVSAAAAVYYTPMTGNLVPIYDGAQFNPTVFAELTLTLVANHLASSIYDAFVFSESGTVTIGTGPAWSTVTAGAGARGSGAGTTELVRTNGVWTNKYSMTARNGATTYTVDAYKGTYVGSIFMDGTNGQISCLRAYGQSRKWGIWNAYNRKLITLKAGDSTASWTPPNTANWRASNNAAANSLTIFSGLPEEEFDIRFTQYIQSSASTGNTNRIGIGVNSTTSPTGRHGVIYITGDTVTHGNDIVALYLMAPTIGINTITALETPSVNTTPFYYGTEASMVLSAQWMG